MNSPRAYSRRASTARSIALVCALALLVGAFVRSRFSDSPPTAAPESGSPAPAAPLSPPEPLSFPALDAAPSAEAPPPPATKPAPAALVTTNEAPPPASTALPDFPDDADIDQLIAYRPNENLWNALAQAFVRFGQSAQGEIKTPEQLQALLPEEMRREFDPAQWEIADYHHTDAIGRPAVTTVLRETRMGKRSQRGHVFADGTVRFMASEDVPR